MEGEQGWEMQGILYRASFRRPPLSGQEFCTVLSLHLSNIYAPKKSVAKKKMILTTRPMMIGYQIDVLAGDHNGTAWRCSFRDNIGTIDEAFADCTLPTPPGPTRCGDPDRSPTTGETSVGSLTAWLRLLLESAHARCVFHPTQQISPYVQPIKAAIMRHGSTLNSSIGATIGPSKATMIGTLSSKYDLQLVHTGTKERRISEAMSDHSLSS